MPRSNTMPARTPCGLETLEPRVMLAGDPLVGLIGFWQDTSGLEGFAIDGSVDSMGTFSGTEQFINSGGIGSDNSPFVNSLTFNTEGGVAVGFESGITSGTGSGSLGSGGLGWFYGSEGGTSSFGLFIERPMSEIGTAGLDGQYNVGLYRFSLAGGNDVFAANPMADDFDGTLSLANGQGTFIASNLDGANPFVQSIALTEAGIGEYTGSDGTVWFSNSDGTALIFIDLTSADNADGFITIGVALREPTQQIGSGDIQGNVYRVAEINAADSGGDLDPNSAFTTAFRLDGSGVVSFLDLNSLNSGTEVVTSTGQWTLAQDRLVIFNSNDDFFEFILGQDGDDAFGDFFFELNGNASSRFAVASLSVPDPDAPGPDPVPDPDPVLITLVQPDGTVFIEDPSDGSFTQTDVFTASGSTLSQADIVESFSFEDEITGRTSVFVTTITGDFVVFSLDGSNNWVETNVTDGIAGTTPLVSDVAIFSRNNESGGGDQVVAVGVDITGDLIMYMQTGATDGSGNPVYEFVNLTVNELSPFGQATPTFPGEIVGFSPEWGATHIAGIDSSGDLVVVWTAPGLDNWFTTNLSDITGVGNLQGNVTLWVQPWGGINIAAVDSAGELVVHWWTPGFGGTWVASSLTDIVGTSQRSSTTDGTTGFIASDGSAVLVTVRDDGSPAGDESLLIYRWDFTTDTWTTQIVNSTPSISVPIADLVGFFNLDGDLLILGSDNDGDATLITLENGASLFTLTDLDAAAVVV
ncbi:MAG: LEPR-XLL domain-containing protein [Planctomycetota bacterium]